MKSRAPTFAILTLGCKVNQYESQALRERLAASGFREDRGDPGLLVVNTCAVTARAESKARKLIRRKLKEFPRARFFLTGCGSRYLRLQGRDPAELIPAQRLTDLPFLPDRKDLPGITYLSGHTRPLVKVQDGCDAFCSYCVIPLVRGRPSSRPAGAVLKEIADLAGAGSREIVLTGTNLGRYRDGPIDLAGLIARACRLPGDFRLRLSSLEPAEETSSLGPLLASESRLCPHLHLPLQSGSDRVLKLMNRNYTRSGYRRWAGVLRTYRPDLALSTDCLVGFPGETDADFELTCRTVEELDFSRVHIFPYSRRPLTRAADWPAPRREVIKRRAAVLGEIAARAARRYRRRFRGGTVEVLVESVENPTAARGLERHYVRTVLSGRGLRAGRLYRGRVTGVEGEELQAELIGG